MALFIRRAIIMNDEKIKNYLYIFPVIILITFLPYKVDWAAAPAGP